MLLKPRISMALLALALFAVAGNAVSNPKQITLANGEWPPLLGQQLSDYGYASQIVSKAFALRGIEVKYQFMPWRRALEETRKGEFAGTLLWSLNEDRKQYFLASDPVYRSKTMLFYHSNKPIKWQKISDLAGKTFGVTNGYSYGAEWEKMRQQQVFLTDLANTDEQNLAKLLSQRIDGFPCEAMVCKHLITSNFPPITQNILVPSHRAVHTETMHVLFSKKQADGQWLVDQFNLGLQEMRRSGELRRLLSALDH